MVTVVDAGAILPVVTSLETLKDSGQEAGPEDERSLCDLMLDQLEFANVILINKCDVVTEDEIVSVEALARKLNREVRAAVSDPATLAVARAHVCVRPLRASVA